MAHSTPLTQTQLTPAPHPGQPLAARRGAATIRPGPILCALALAGALAPPPGACAEESLPRDALGPQVKLGACTAIRHSWQGCEGSLRLPEGRRRHGRAMRWIGTTAAGRPRTFAIGCFAGASVVAWGIDADPTPTPHRLEIGLAPALARARARIGLDWYPSERAFVNRHRSSASAVQALVALAEPAGAPLLLALWPARATAPLERARIAVPPGLGAALSTAVCRVPPRG